MRRSGGVAARAENVGKVRYPHPRSGRSSRPRSAAGYSRVEQRRLIAVVAASAVAVAGAAVVALHWPGDGGGTAAAAPPETSTVNSVDIAPADPKATSLNLPERGTPMFSMLGMSWTDPKAAPHGTVQVRTRSAATGAWTSWQTLGSDDSQ